MSLHMYNVFEKSMSVMVSCGVDRNPMDCYELLMRPVNSFGFSYGFYGNPVACYGFLYEFLWIPMGSYRFRMGSYGIMMDSYVWIPMNSVGILWTLMDSYGFHRIRLYRLPMNSIWILWMSMDSCEFLWFPMDPSGFKRYCRSIMLWLSIENQLFY